MSLARLGGRRYAGPGLKNAKVHHAMRVGVITCRPETRLSDVARMMAGYDVHSVVVADVGRPHRAWGIVSSLDLARAPNKLGYLTAADVASTDLVTIPSDAPLKRAAELMAEHRVSHLIATEPSTDQPAGVISANGLAAALAYGRS